MTCNVSTKKAFPQVQSLLTDEALNWQKRTVMIKIFYKVFTFVRSSTQTQAHIFLLNYQVNLWDTISF